MIPVVAYMLVAAAPSDPHPAWMAGTWGWQNEGEAQVDCHFDHSPTYHSKGTYDFIDQSGTWRIIGDTLIETLTDPGETGDPKMRGKPQVRRFERIAPGVLAVGGEYPGKMIKCD